VAQQIRQLGDIDGDALRFILAEPVHDALARRLILEIDVGQELTVGILNERSRAKRGSRRT
jgi:hypothetical protein